MEFLFSFIAELFAEVVLQGLFELIAAGLKRVFGVFFGAVREVSPEPRPLHPAARWALYCLFGFLAGAISVWLFPRHFIPHGVMRRVGVVITPVLLGLAFVALGRWRKRRGRKPSDFDQFGCGAAFAAGMAIVRALALA
jgi:hypothetical protein